jgi:enoyl-[acyl-carrier protein] reductase I
MLSTLLKDKTALVTGVADNVGFGWHIAKTLQAAGANVIVSCHPRVKSILERFLDRDKYVESRELPFGEGHFSPIGIISCDAALDTASDLGTADIDIKGYDDGDVSINGAIAKVQALSGSLDILIHSIAFSPEVTKSHLEVSRAAYLTAMSVSSYSMVALTRAALPLMRGRSASVVGLTYLAGERAVPFYGGGMASAKAALECDARMLAWEIGSEGHRVNMISAGPYASRAAKAIGEIDDMIAMTAARSPLRRSIEPNEVANAALFLCSSLASGITGEVIHVDAGYHAMGV